MTVHMFRCFIGRGEMSITDLETQINDWVASNAEWENDSVEHALTERNTAIDGSGETFHAIDVRFLPDADGGDTKDNLLQKFTDKLENKVGWYRVGYHECTHREGDGSSGPCSWDDSTEWTDKDVSIPSGVPGFNA